MNSELYQQRWRKLGVLRTTDGQTLTGAMLPTPLRLNDTRVRLYYGGIGAELVSRLRYVEVELAEPTVVVSASPGVLLDVGEAGHFDDNGVVPTAVVEHAGELRLYYAGFQRQTKIPYTIFTGLAISEDGGLSFRRAQTTPVLERSTGEAFFRAAPCLLPTPFGWRMWYIGGGGWIADGDRRLPTYSLRTCESADGRLWPPEGEVCLAPAGEEIGFGRPYLLRTPDRYRMWYSIRRRPGYHLGYAESTDGKHWRRMDELLDLGPPLRGFDDQMTCYPAVVERGADLLLFYNGNGYGRTGIGVAVLGGETRS